MLSGAFRFFQILIQMLSGAFKFWFRCFQIFSHSDSDAFRGFHIPMLFFSGSDALKCLLILTSIRSVQMLSHSDALQVISYSDTYFHSILCLVRPVNCAPSSAPEPFAPRIIPPHHLRPSQMRHTSTASAPTAPQIKIWMCTVVYKVSSKISMFHYKPYRYVYTNAL